MAGFDVYVLVLCVIVFLLLTATLGYGIWYITKLTIKLIKAGQEDEKLKTEYDKYLKKQKGNKALSILDRVVSLCLFVVVLGAFVFALCTNVNGDKKVGDTPVLQVVQSGSMAYRSEYNNKVGNKPEIDNQIQVFDLIVIHKLPAEQDLKLYDIVVYEVENTLIAHRIVGIEDPNDKHSERYFLLQGDAVANPDRFPVKYEQMKGIYRNQRIPFVGSLIMFLQSPAGYICIILIAFGIFATPAVEKRIWAIKFERLAQIGYLDTYQEQQAEQAATGICQVVFNESKPDTQPKAYNGKTVVRVRVDKNAIDIKLDKSTGRYFVEQADTDKKKTK